MKRGAIAAKPFGQAIFFSFIMIPVTHQAFDVLRTSSISCEEDDEEMGPSV